MFLVKTLMRREMFMVNYRDKINVYGKLKMFNGKLARDKINVYGKLSRDK